MIPYGRQSIDEADVAAVVKVLNSERLTQGPQVEEFEDALRAVTGAEHVVAFSSGTGALHGAAAAAGLGPGDSVATSPLTFAGSANCARYVGARPFFVDIDPATLNLDVNGIPNGADAVVAVHFAGLPLDLSHLRRRPRVVIEDAAHALGAMTPDGPVGNCAHSDLCVFSFHPVKAVTTGEGGAVTTNSAQLAERLRRFRNHDIVADPDQGGWYYEIPGDGYNYRLSDMHAALGASQLTKLERFIKRRQALAERYRGRLADLPVELPPEPPPGYSHAYHLFPVRVDDRRGVYERMRAAGIGVQVHYVPLYRHPIFASSVRAGERFPNTDRAYERILSLPIFPDLTETDQDTVLRALEEAL
jgi:dTDP-4-amino-4,6-dideoxygalactose transaminase